MSGQCPGCGAVGECYCDGQKLDIEKLIKERDEAMKSSEEWQQKYADQCALCHDALHKLDDERIDSAVETLYATKATERAEKAEAEVKKLREQLREGCTCGSGAHPRPCKRHPEAYEAHVESLNTETALDEAKEAIKRLRDRLQIDPGGSDKIDELEQAIEFLRHDLEIARAKAEVFGGEWCAKNRAEGRGPCGACAWCVARYKTLAERALVIAEMPYKDDEDIEELRKIREELL